MHPLWRKIQKKNFTSLKKLVAFLQLNSEQEHLLHSAPGFVLNVPLRLAEKMRKGTLNDPLVRQFLPLDLERKSAEGFLQDPVGDEHVRKGGKLLHKYQGRVLLLVSGACAMHCRYCFRQNFPYETSVKNFDFELSEIEKDSSISEVILSGGDPLSVDDRLLSKLFSKFEEIKHLKRVRFHTRFPIGIPERINEDFLSVLKNSPLQTIFVVHINHSQELDKDVLVALKKLQMLGCPVISQSVLLKGVNDTVNALKELFNTLIDNGILPYYLHQLDRVSGAQHFEVPEERGLEILENLRVQLPGYALPQYVREVPGELSKTPILAKNSGVEMCG